MRKHAPHENGSLCPRTLCLALALLTGAVPCLDAGTIPPDMDLRDFRAVIQGATRDVFPAVVFVKCVRETMESGKKDSHEVVGSGVLISGSGEILSNWHVVDRATEVRCMLYDGRAFDARVVGSDKDTDLALLQLVVPPGSGPLPFARLGDSTLMSEGDFVMAMGAPWGLSRSVSMGIISCARRYLPGDSEYNLWLQTDASISPGNSGGPLVNTEGEVVGINALGILMGGDTGFAIPSAVIRDVLGPIREHGRVNWTWTGLELQPLRDFNRNVYFDYSEGVMIAGTSPASPARRAGVLTGDRLVRVNGQPLTALHEEDLSDIRRALSLLPHDQPAEFAIMRQGQQVAFDITPREKGEVEGADMDCPRWGFTVRSINRFDNPDLFFYRPEGVFVYGIQHPGNASRSDLRPADILLRIDREDVGTLEDVERAHADAVAALPAKHRVLITVLRNGQQHQLVLDYSRDYRRE